MPILYGRKNKTILKPVPDPKTKTKTLPVASGPSHDPTKILYGFDKKNRTILKDPKGSGETDGESGGETTDQGTHKGGKKGKKKATTKTVTPFNWGKSFLWGIGGGGKSKAEPTATTAVTQKNQAADQTGKSKTTGKAGKSTPSPAGRQSMFVQGMMLPLYDDNEDEVPHQKTTYVTAQEPTEADGEDETDVNCFKDPVKWAKRMKMNLLKRIWIVLAILFVLVCILIVILASVLATRKAKDENQAWSVSVVGLQKDGKTPHRHQVNPFDMFDTGSEAIQSRIVKLLQSLNKKNQLYDEAPDLPVAETAKKCTVPPQLVDEVQQNEAAAGGGKGSKSFDQEIDDDSSRFFPAIQPAIYKLHFQIKLKEKKFRVDTRITGMTSTRITGEINSFRLHLDTARVFREWNISPHVSFRMWHRKDRTAQCFKRIVRIHRDELRFELHENSPLKSDEIYDFQAMGLDGHILTDDFQETAVFGRIGGARSMFPCVDHPKAKALFMLSTETIENSELQTVSGFDEADATSSSAKIGRLQSAPADSLLKGYKTKTMSFNVTMPLPPHAFSFVICKKFATFGFHGDTGIPYQFHLEASFSRAEGITRNLYRMSVEADKCIQYMQKVTGSVYPWDKLSFVHVAKKVLKKEATAGIIDSPALVQSDPLKEEPERFTKKIIEQWIGNMITVPSWKQVCVYKGLVKYLYLLYTQTLSVLAVFRYDEMLKETFWNAPVMDVGDRRVISVESPNIEKCEMRVALILDMLSATFGPDKAGPKGWLRTLIAKYPYDNPGYIEWATEISNSIGSPTAGKILKTYLIGRGYPFLYIERDGADGGLKVTQVVHETANSTVRIPKPDPFSTPILLTYIGGGSLFKIMDSSQVTIKMTKKALSVGRSWYVLDVDRAILARSIYDMENYAALFTCFRGKWKAVQKYQKVLGDCPNLPMKAFAQVYADFCFAFLHNLIQASSTSKDNRKLLMNEAFDNIRDFAVAYWHIDAQLYIPIYHPLVGDNWKCGCCLARKEDFNNPEYHALNLRNVINFYPYGSCTLEFWITNCAPLQSVQESER